MTVTLGGVAGQRLVDGVVDDLVDHVMQAGAVIGVADIHARPLAHGIEALEDLDRFRAVIGRVGAAGGRVRPCRNLRIRRAKCARNREVWCDTKRGCRTGQSDAS